MVEKKTIAGMMVGSSVGVAQTFVLREYVDKVYGKIPGLEGLGGFGTYSAMIGIISGAITTGLGLGSVLTGKIIKNETIQLFLIGHGIPALVSGGLSGLFPVPPPTLRAPAKAPAGAPAQQVNLRFAGNLKQPAPAKAPAPATRAAGQVGQTKYPLRT